MVFHCPSSFCRGGGALTDIEMVILLAYIGYAEENACINCTTCPKLILVINILIKL